jgi:hypothetical protein
MSDALTIPSSPAFSPALGRAQRLSKVMTVLMTIGFWATLVVISFFPIIMALAIIWHPLPSYFAEVRQLWTPGLARLGLIGGAAGIIASLPSLFIFHHAKHVFAYFAKGEVFNAGPISHMCSAGLWLIVSMIAASAAQLITAFALWGYQSFHPRLIDLLVSNLLRLHFSTLFVGIAVYVTAYVMAEAQRIAADNAKII